jgi:superfamily I DNA/RNA helicase
MRAGRAQARALVAGRKLGARTRHGRVLAWLDTRGPSEAVLRQLGADVLLSAALRRLANPLRAFVRGVPARYRRFRRLRLAEGRWYQRVAQASGELSPLELDLVLLGMLRAARLLLHEPRLASAIHEPALQSLRPFQELLRTQIFVDEATDFSPLQLACMAALCDPETESFFACGDFNQRITVWGTRSADELRWILPDVDIRTIRVTYRHSRQLNALAHRVAQLMDEAHEAAALPEFVDNEGVEPVLGLGLSGAELVAWLKARILEIERVTQVLPSIAILVNREDEAQPLADALQAAMAGENIQCVACPGGQVRGHDNDVRVFDVQHIKGLEFEAVFFVGVDELAQARPELFDKFIYVGATRAAMYLGLTTTAPDLPVALAPLRDAFGETWSGR